MNPNRLEPLKLYHHCPNGDACDCEVKVHPPELADRIQLVLIPQPPLATMRVNIRHSDEWIDLDTTND